MWDVKTDGPVNGSAAVIGDITFVAGLRQRLHVLDAKTGKELYAVDLAGRPRATAAVVGDRAFVGTMANTVVARRSEEEGTDLDIRSAAAAAAVLRLGRGRRQASSSPAAATRRSTRSTRTPASEAGASRPTGRSTPRRSSSATAFTSAACRTTGHFYVLDLKTGKKIQEHRTRLRGDRLGRRRPGLHPGRHRQGHALLPREEVTPCCTIVRLS